jgi:catechol 2,3-dioxygenase-like lactoylglutathione lyase family enzyme
MEMELFAGVAVSDYPKAVKWFEALLGMPATFEATDTECVWTLSEHRSIYVELRPERAGHAMVTVILDDLDGFVEAAAGRGVHPETQETYDNGMRKATYRDSEGNEIGFGGAPVEAPSPPGA